MNTKIFLLALGLVACMAAWAAADGGFGGIITFYGCHCINPYDKVRVTPASGGQYDYGADCIGSLPYGYTTEGGTPQTFPPGNYYISFLIRQESDCDHTYVQYVQHGSSWQEVNLTVYGPDGGETGPPGP